MNKDILKKIFRIPNYLSLPVAGLEICNRSIKYVEFSDDNGKPYIKNFGEFPLPINVVKDGNILNKDVLVKALVEVKKNLTCDFVKVAIPEEKTYIFDVLLPKEAKDNIRQALEFKIEENVPLKFDESVFEYEIVEKNYSLTDMIVNVSVIPKRVLADYSEILDQSNLYPVSFEIESKMIASSTVDKGNNKNSIILDIKDDSSILVAVINDNVRLSASISIGENSIIETLNKIETFKNKEVANDIFNNDFSFDSIYTKESYLSLINIVSIFKDEVEKFNQYILNKFPNIRSSKQAVVDRIVVCGRSASLPGLTKHINQNLKTEITLANTLMNVCDVDDCTSNIKFQEALNYATTIGLIVASQK